MPSHVTAEALMGLASLQTELPSPARIKPVYRNVAYFFIDFFSFAV
jgi:hypothetical protein